MIFRVTRRLFATVLALGFQAAWLRAEPGMPFTDEPGRLVSDGVFRGKIFISSNATPEERDSAEYLAKWIHRVTGAVPVVAVESPGRREPGIYLGDTRKSRDAGVAAPVTDSHDSFAWESRERGTLFIVGESPLATRLAIGRFISEKLGVTFVAPGEFGADWVPRRTIEMPVSRREFVPAFEWRQFSGMKTPAEKIWALDNGLGKLPAMNHALWDVFDAEAFAENSAMFPMLGGKITGPSGRGGYEPQPNLANPDSAKYAAKRAWEFFRKTPGAPAFSLSINDNMTWDESPESKTALGSGKYFRNRPDYSDYVFRFANRTASALRRLEAGEVTPGSGHIPPGPRLLTSYAYYHCENTPSFGMDPGVFPILTADRSEWRDASYAAEDAALMDRWAKSGVSRFGIYDYYYGLNMAVPRIFFKAQADSVKHAAKAGASLFYAELNPDWGFDGPKAWLAAKLTWNPDADAGDLLDAYYDSAYGSAASAMRRLYEIAESRWTHRNQPPRWIRFFREESVAELFPVPVVAEMRAALNEAEGEFPSARLTPARDGGRMERQRLRVRATSISFAKVEAFVTRYGAMKRLAELPDATDETGVDRVREALAECERTEVAYRTAVSRWNSAAINPGAPFDPDIFWRSDVVNFAVAKCADQWKSLRVDSRLPVLAAACLAEKPPEGVETVLNEAFEWDSFRPPTPGAWSERKGLTIPKSPWRINLFEAEHTRFGYSTERAASGKGSLIVAGGDLAKLTRTLPVFTGDTVAVGLRYSGKIIPGVHVALKVGFYDATGRAMAGGSQAIALPCDDAGWRKLAAFGVAPSGAESAEVFLHVMNQEATDALWVDDLVIRRCALGEPLE